jgi:DNA/RNA endonuclease G (NUC1)
MPPAVSTSLSANRFESLTEIRAAHAELLHGSSDEPSEADQGRIAEFIRKAVATGEVLDSPDDRRQSQGLIDYWSATLVSTNRDSPASGGRTTSLRVKPGSAILVQFDPRTVTNTIEAAEAWVKGQSEADREAVGRILLRLVRLPEGQRTFVTATATRESLVGMAPSERITAILDNLTALKIARPTADDGITLANETLIRQWPAYARWTEQRLRFRDTARYWNQSARNSAGLVTGELLDRARSYHDLDALEQEFVDACRNRELKQTRNYRLLAVVFAGLLFATLVGLVFSIWGYAKSESTAGELKTKKDELETSNIELGRLNGELNESITAKDLAITKATERGEALKREVDERNELFTKLKTLAADQDVQDLAKKNKELEKLIAGLGPPTWVPSPYNPKFLGDAFPLETPVLKPHFLRDAYKGGQLIDYVHYSLAFNMKRRLMFFAAVNVDRKNLDNSTPSPIPYRFDTRIPFAIQTGNELYSYKNLVPGGIARPSELRRKGDVDSSEASNTAFFFTNACPMDTNFHDRGWNRLMTSAIQDFGSDSDRITLIKGPVLRDDDYQQWGGYKIPRQYWLIAIKKVGTAPPLLQAFLLDHYRFSGKERIPDYIIYPPTGVFRPERYRVTLFQLETETGLTFDSLKKYEQRLPAKAN